MPSKQGGLGYDVGKNIPGRKRHLLVETLGLLLAMVVHSAAIQDRDGAKWLFVPAAALFPAICLVWADGGYAEKLIDWLGHYRRLSKDYQELLDEQRGHDSNRHDPTAAPPTEPPGTAPETMTALNRHLVNRLYPVRRFCHHRVRSQSP